jgi:hypothetical protein
MREIASNKTPLNWDVFVAKRQGLTRDLPPGKEQWTWVAGSATLICGAGDAVLVDTLLTVDQNRALAFPPTLLRRDRPREIAFMQLLRSNTGTND